MGNAALSFATGLGSGYVDTNRYQNRQDEIAREQALRESEFQMRKALADEALAEKKRAVADQESIRDAAKPAEAVQSATLDTGDGAKVYSMPAGVDGQDVAASDARQFRRNTEETTGAEAPMPAVSSATTVNGKAFPTRASGLKAAAEYNDPTAKNLRIAAALEAAGRPDAAMEYRAKAEKFKQDMYDAQRQALFRSGAEFIARGDIRGLLDSYNQHYNDGKTAMLSTDGKVILQKDRDGVTVGELPVGSKDDMLLAFRDLVFPDKRAEAQAAGRAQAAAEANKSHIIPAGGAVYQGGRITATNDNGLVPVVNPDGTTSMVKPGAGGKVDHFEPKQWDAASKIDKSVVSFLDPLMGKEIENGSLRSSYLQAFNAAKASGAMTPNEAVEFATTSTTKLKELAQEQVNRSKAADKSSKLTVEQAASAIAQSPAWQQRVKLSLPAPSQQPESGRSQQSAGGARVEPGERQGYIDSMKQLLATNKDPNPATSKGIEQEIARVSKMTDAQYLAEMTAGAGGPNGRYASQSSAPNRGVTAQPAAKPAATTGQPQVQVSQAPALPITPATTTTSVGGLSAAKQYPGQYPDPLPIPPIRSSDDYTKNQALRDAVVARVKQAQTSGPPLGVSEKMIAKQLGLLA